jgi:AraC-like DNA-binding protein
MPDRFGHRSSGRHGYATGTVGTTGEPEVRCLIDDLNRALDHIEQHLDDIDVDELARFARTSTYHLRRMFSALAGMPLSTYVRRRRMTLAAADVQAGRGSLLDIAVRYGYGSTEAFGRAFRGVHGVAPREARGGGVDLMTQPRLLFRLTVEGRITMKHRPDGLWPLRPPPPPPHPARTHTRHRSPRNRRKRRPCEPRCSG